MVDFLDATQPGGIAGLAARLAREHPTFVVVGALSDSTWQLPHPGRPLPADGPRTGWIWYLSDDAGPDALAARARGERRGDGPLTARVRTDLSRPARDREECGLMTERQFPDMWVDPEDDPRETDRDPAGRRRCWPSTSTATG